VPPPTLHVPKPVLGQWDRDRIEQVVLNLLTNAIRYGLGKPVHVSIHAIPGGVRLAVRDHGKGVPPEHRERIFDRFERLGDGGAVRGLGLGLFITKQIVHAHHGRIYVEAPEGGGSRFVVELPCTAPERSCTEETHSP
jgi:signal transduction histidine kinase